MQLKHLIIKNFPFTGGGYVFYTPQTPGGVLILPVMGRQTYKSTTAVSPPSTTLQQGAANVDDVCYFNL